MEAFRRSPSSIEKSDGGNPNTVKSSLLLRHHLKKRRKMEGIRLRSDSDGSTKNAFYQGTIVSDAAQGCCEEDVRSSISAMARRKKTRVLNVSTISNLSSVNGTDNRTPPLPRRSMKTKSSGSAFATSRLSKMLSPDIILDDGEESIFEFGQHVGDIRDSLSYSTQSMFSNMTLQNSLLGTSFLSDEGTQLERSTLDNLGSSTENAKGSDETTMPTAEDYEDLDFTRESVARDSSASIGSGVYFNQPAPPGPLRPGMVYGSFQPRRSSSVSSRFPIQQLNDVSGSTLGPGAKGRKAPPIFTAQEPTIAEDDNEDGETSEENICLSERIVDWVDISAWLSQDLEYNANGLPEYDPSLKWTLRGIIRFFVYNPTFPEFSSLQQVTWAVIIGAFMGVFTAGWKVLIDASLLFTWKTLPEKLLEWGLFTDLDGAFPLFHYMWIVPSLLGGILSYIINAMETPIPTQDDWIHTLHSRGVEESDTFIPLFLFSTLGMTSGLSLGPELPLVLTAGMIGSWLGVLCHQSMIQARIMNLTAASAAIGGFFGFPMAGALFVLELPHRMGLQYFEALSPASIASVVAVLINRIVINNDVTGMFQYPFLNESLPSYIFKDAIIYGLFGGALGIFYTLSIKNIKIGVLHLLDNCDSSPIIHETSSDLDMTAETIPLVGSTESPTVPPSPNSNSQKKCPACGYHLFSGLIPHKPTRAGITGMLSGFVVGITGIFLPHVMFWGEAQLQTMIDKGRTPLPVFGQHGEPTAALVALGQCTVNQSDDSGFGIGCSLAIILAKIFVTGVSLGTGIVGGHFWAPRKSWRFFK
jgi:H+/Cl- antiporter ClcA